MSARAGRARTFRILCAGAAAASLVVSAAACGGGGAAADPPTPESTYGGAVAAAEAPAPEGYEAARIEGVQINVPNDWKTEKADHRLCMRPPDQDGCGYGSLQVLPHAAKRDPAKWPKKGDAFRKKNGWASSPESCRSPGTFESGDIGIKSARKDTGDFTTHADGLKSNHTVWTVTCENGDTFEVRLWFLPVSDVVVYVPSADARYTKIYDEIAKSMDVSEYKK